MNATCPACTCAGLGTCPACQRISAVVAAESAAPRRPRDGFGPATATDFLAASDDRAALLADAQQALDGMTVLQRQALVARFVDRLPVWRVARRLALPARMVPGLLDAAETKLTQPRAVPS